MNQFDEENTEFFINLTTGLEWSLKENYLWLSKNPQFTRIQSTHFENKHFEIALKDVDNNLLMKLAIGRNCVILDCTSRKVKNNTSRACWQGIAWIKYCLERVWFHRKIKCNRGMHDHFDKEFNKLSRCTLKKLKYYRKFLLTDKVKLWYLCDPTDNDSNLEYYKQIVKEYF